MEKVLFEKKGPVAYVTINRPELLNACDFEAYGRLAQIWREFRDDPALRVASIRCDHLPWSTDPAAWYSNWL